MKKLVFTAIAVIAFSGVSMAESKTVKSVDPTVEDCYDNAMNFLDEFGTGDDVIDEQIWQILIADC